MDILAGLALNIVYGFLFFVALGVMVLTLVMFAMAAWSITGRWRRTRRQQKGSGS